MAEQTPTQNHTYETIDGVEALINLDPGELFLDLPISTPRYIRVREGEQIQEGDVRTQPSQMGSQTLRHWRIETIGTDTVTGVDVETGESQEWDREWLIQHLGSGEFSVKLTGFDRVSVSDTTRSEMTQADDQQDEVFPHLIVTAYGNNGQKFTQSYSATESGDWKSLRIVKQDKRVQEFGEELREKFDAAVAEALEMEQQYY